MQKQTIDMLPDDVLYIIVSLLSVQDILRTRQVCKNFRRITTHRTVWWDAYKRSGILRAPGPLESHSAQDLESLLVKASKLDEKFTSPSAQPVSRRTITIAPQMGMESIDLIFGRYLSIFGRNELVFFDLDATDDNLQNNPIFSYGTKNNSNIFLHLAIGPNHGTENALLALISSQTFKGRRDFTIHIFNICPSESPQIRHIAEIPTTRHNARSVKSVGNDCLLLHDDGGPKLIHIPSRTRFQLTLTSPQGFNLHKLIMTSTHIIAFCINFSTSSGYLEAFPFPAISSPSSGAELTITSSHTGPLPFALTEPMMTDIAARLMNSEIVMTFLALTYNTSLEMTLLYLFNIALPPRNRVPTFTGLHHVPLDRLAWDLHGTASHGVARAICSVGLQRRLLTYFILKDDNGNLRIRNGTELGVLEENLDLYFGLPFDAMRGRLCYSNSSGEVYILDYI